MHCYVVPFVLRQVKRAKHTRTSSRSKDQQGATGKSDQRGGGSARKYHQGRDNKNSRNTNSEVQLPDLFQSQNRQIGILICALPLICLIFLRRVAIRSSFTIGRWARYLHWNTTIPPLIANPIRSTLSLVRLEVAAQEAVKTTTAGRAGNLVKSITA